MDPIIIIITWRWPQQQWPKHVVDVDKLYTPDNIVVLWLLYPYRIITLGSNKHNGDDGPWSSLDYVRHGNVETFYLKHDVAQ